MFDKVKATILGERATKFHIVKIGWTSFYFTNEEDAFRFYQLVNTLPSLVNLEHVMVDKIDEEKKDYSGYEYLYFVDKPKDITLGLESVVLVSKDEARKRADEAAEKKQIAEAQKAEELRIARQKKKKGKS